MDSKTLKKYFAGFLFGLICLVFVFFGLPQNLGPLGGGIVAEVNGEVVSVAEYREMRQRIEQSQNFNMGNLNRALRESMRKMMNDRTVQYLVNEILVYQGAYDQGMRVSDAEVRDYIIEVPAFNDDGVFQKSVYKQYLKSTQKSAGQFEQELRMSKQRQRVQSIIEQAVKPTQQQIDLEFQLAREEYNLEFLRITDAAIEAAIVINDAEADQKLAGKEFKAKAEKEFSDNQAKYNREFEKVKAKHILVKLDEKKKDAAAEALKKANELRKGLNRDNFAELAKKHSTDTVSAQKGGDLGFFARGKMVKEFEDKAFSMKPGEISGPVKSQFGYHIIMVDEVKKGDFETNKIEIAKRLLRKERVADASKELTAAVKSGNIDSVLKKYQLSWTETGKFSLAASSIPRLGDDQSLFDEVLAFKKGTKKMSDKLIETAGAKFLLKLKSKSSAEKVDRKQLSETLQREQVAMVTGDWIDGLRKNGSVRVNQQLIR